MKYAKGILALLVALGTVLVTALGTSPQQSLSNFGWIDWLSVIVAFLGTGAFTTWVTNVPGVAGGVMKAIAAGLGSFCTAVITAHAADGIVSQAEWIGAITAAVIAFLGVYQVKNLGLPGGSTPKAVAEYATPVVYTETV